MPNASSRRAPGLGGAGFPVRERSVEGRPGGETTRDETGSEVRASDTRAWGSGVGKREGRDTAAVSAPMTEVHRT